MAAPFVVRSAATSATTFKSSGSTMSAESVIAATSEVTGEGRGEAVAAATSEVTGRRGDESDINLWVQGIAAASSDEITGEDGAADWDVPAEQVETQFEPAWPAWEDGLLSDWWLGGL